VALDAAAPQREALISLLGPVRLPFLGRAVDESDNPSDPSVIPNCVGTLAISDSLPAFIPAFAGSPLYNPTK
jgi:hypothetical protein